jgi:hypothetical protein
MVAHLKESQRDSWGPNDEVSFYLGPSLEHYQCMKVYFQKQQQNCKGRGHINVYSRLYSIPITKT